MVPFTIVGGVPAELIRNEIPASAVQQMTVQIFFNIDVVRY
jgi:acetyltransferase-like isoleucine patch superfamily enzyme